MSQGYFRHFSDISPAKLCPVLHFLQRAAPLSLLKSTRRQCELKMGALNVLIGTNGAGKSNLIGFFKLIALLLEQQLQRTVGRSGGPDVMPHYHINIRTGIQRINLMKIKDRNQNR